MSNVYDRQGRPISYDEWADLRERDLVVEKTTIGGIDISTVWLGLDHQWDPDGPPHIFETMIFEQGPLDQECWRYSTEADALAGHRRACDKVRFALSCRFAGVE